MKECWCFVTNEGHFFIQHFQKQELAGYFKSALKRQVSIMEEVSK